MNPVHLRSFVAVAEELHFGRAAKRLHLSQPPLSMQIKKLESELGTLLFERTRRSVALTAAGDVLLGRARHILAETVRAEAEVKRIASGAGGTLSIGYTPTATYRVLPKLVKQFHKANPQVPIELIEMRSAQLPDAIREGRIEVGYACGPLQCPDLSQTTIDRERFIAALPDKHPLAKAKTIDVTRLIREPFVIVRPDIEPVWAHAFKRKARVAQMTDSKIAMLGLIAAGVGVSVVSESMQTLKRDGVVYRPLKGERAVLKLTRISSPAPTPRAQAWLNL